MPHCSIRENMPAINVRDRNLWARDPRTDALMAELGEQTVSAIYEGVRADFWQDIAPDIAREHGFGDVYAEGRSDGWLCVRATFLDCVDSDPARGSDPFPITGELGDVPDSTDREHNRAELERLEDRDESGDYELAAARVERDRFLAFADAIDGAVKAAGEMFVQRLGEAFAELEIARDRCAVRSVN